MRSLRQGRDKTGGSYESSPRWASGELFTYHESHWLALIEFQRCGSNRPTMTTSWLGAGYGATYSLVICEEACRGTYYTVQCCATRQVRSRWGGRDLFPAAVNPRQLSPRRQYCTVLHDTTGERTIRD